MKAPHLWSYQHFLSNCAWDLNGPACDTFACWLTLISKNDFQYLLPLLPDLFSWQYECDEQATSVDDLYSAPEIMPQKVRPIAPIILLRLWSPFPLVCHLLGDPEHFIEHQKYGSAAWTPKAEAKAVYAHPTDIQFFQNLILKTIQEALFQDMLVALTGTIGWSCNADNQILSKQRKLMERAGFLEFRRRPKESRTRRCS